MLSSTTRKNAERPAIPRINQIQPDPFIFVPITQVEAAKGRGAAKRIVRAHVTRIQHSKSSTFTNLHDIQNWTVRPYIPRDPTAAPRRKLRNGDEAGPKNKTRRQQPDEERVWELRAAELLDKVLVPKLPAGTGSEDPFWTYPVDHEPYLSPIFAHYIQNIAVEIPDIDGPNDRGLLRSSWFPLAMTEAATMYAVLLMAASHFCIVNPGSAASIDLLALKARALSEINAAVASQNRRLTDATIGAVAKLAAYEAVFGDSDVFAAHMKGLQMMLNMRGGLSTLGLNGLLERMLVWIDLNAAHLTGKDITLGGELFPTEVHFAAPDPYHFAGIS